MAASLFASNGKEYLVPTRIGEPPGSASRWGGGFRRKNPASGNCREVRLGLVRMLDIEPVSWGDLSAASRSFLRGIAWGSRLCCLKREATTRSQAQLKRRGTARLANIAAEKASEPQKDTVIYGDFDRAESG